MGSDCNCSRLVATRKQTDYRLWRRLPHVLVFVTFNSVHNILFERLMLIPQYLLEILRCPVCKARVHLEQEESCFKCESCRRVYPVRDEIPVMLAEEAQIA